MPGIWGHVDANQNITSRAICVGVHVRRHLPPGYIPLGC
jgi:hypothetical protein